MLSIRRFDPAADDYAAIVAIYNANWPDERHYAAELWRDEDEEWPAGVLRAYRGRGIATVLKVRTIEFARQLDASTIEPHDEEDNLMVHLNLKLGLRPKAAWVSCRWKLLQAAVFALSGTADAKRDD